MKTMRQVAGDNLLNFARATITKPEPKQIAAFGKRLEQIMTRDQQLHPETLIFGREAIEFLPATAAGTGIAGYKDLDRQADALEKIHHRIKDADYLRAIGLCTRAYHALTDYDRITYTSRACVKALYCCGLADEIKTALVLVF